MKKAIFSTSLLAVILFGITACDNSDTNIDKSTVETEWKDDSKKNEMHQKWALKQSKGEMLRTDMRKLWEDHVIWTRNVIFCLVDNLPGKEQALNRLMQNQDDIGDAVKNYYGNDAGIKLSELLREHIAISADVVMSAKKDDKKALEAANKKWHDNADDISTFLANANPNWKLDDMKNMMCDHLKLTTDEAVARIKKDYDNDVKTFDKVHEQILKMSDMLSKGIIKQFPDKFKKTISA